MTEYLVIASVFFVLSLGSIFFVYGYVNALIEPYELLKFFPVYAALSLLFPLVLYVLILYLLGRAYQRYFQ